MKEEQCPPEQQHFLRKVDVQNHGKAADVDVRGRLPDPEAEKFASIGTCSGAGAAQGGHAPAIVTTLVWSVAKITEASLYMELMSAIVLLDVKLPKAQGLREKARATARRARRVATTSPQINLKSHVEMVRGRGRQSSDCTG